MHIFLSYASEQKNVAEQLAFGLRNSGHDVFFDRADLPAAGDYNARIRAAIDDSELFVYCISPESVADGSYARTELRFAQERFGKAVNRVLPVMIVPTPYDSIPNFAKSVTVLEEPSNVVAEVLQVVARLASSRGEKVRAWTLIGLAAILALNAVYRWVTLRVELHWVIAFLAMTAVVIAPLAYWYWRRLALSGSKWLWAAPLTLCAAAAFAGWLAGEFRPVTVWLLPGSSLTPLIPADGGQSQVALDVLVDNERAAIASFRRSGVLIGANSTIIGLARSQGSANAVTAMKSYLVQRGVPEQFHEDYIALWRAQDPAEINIRVRAADDVRIDRLSIRTRALTPVLDSLGSSPLQLIFVESSQ
jgi:hypothetical protein